MTSETQKPAHSQANWLSTFPQQAISLFRTSESQWPLFREEERNPDVQLVLGSLCRIRQSWSTWLLHNLRDREEKKSIKVRDRLTEQPRLEGTPRGCLVQPLVQSRVRWNRLLLTMCGLSFEYLHEWRPHDLSGQPVPVVSHPHSKRVFFLCLNATSCISVCAQCPVSLVLALDVTEKSIPPSSFLSHQIFIHTDKTPLSLLQAAYSQLSGP